MDRKSKSCLVAACILIDANPSILDIACFHCQQCIEKYLKAFLIYNDEELVFTHNLEYLLQQCAAFDEDFAALDMKELTTYAVRARYPHDYNAPELYEAKEYYEIAVQIKELVLTKIRWED